MGVALPNLPTQFMTTYNVVSLCRGFMTDGAYLSIEMT